MKKLNILSAGLALFAAATISSCSSISDQEYEINGVKFKMIAVEGGSFMMGATPGQGEDARDNEKPAHKVTVDDFLIGETEVTQELWFAVMGNNPSYFKSGEGNLPVENVSWNDVQEFIIKLNKITGLQFRLPFEAEWEYAARGGAKSSDYKYAGSVTIDDVAWHTGNSENSTHPVASKKANELGLFDMSGNVWELCYDWSAKYDENLCNMRGGSFQNLPSFMRVSLRFLYPISQHVPNIGFRIALSTH